MNPGRRTLRPPRAPEKRDIDEQIEAMIEGLD